MPRRVVLVGAGHAHVQLLRRLAMAPWRDAEVTLIVDRPVSLYSGMVPGLLAGQYAAHELSIDAHVLARRAGARVIHAAATRVDAVQRLIHLAGRPPIAYELASLNVGSTVALADLPGVAEHALPTRPLSRLLDALDALSGAPARSTVVGAGAAGVELAAALRARGHTVTLVDGGEAPMQAQRARVRARVARALSARGITLRLGARVESVAAGAVTLSDGEALAHDHLIWAAGAAPPALCAASDLPKDARGYVRVGHDLRVVGHPDLFAAGDCAVPDQAPWVPRAGVYAVRSGPVLADNLEASLRGWPLRRWRPQRDFLTLLNLGDGTALGFRGPLVAEGAWVFRLKDRIDRRFVQRFQMLEPGGRPARGAPAMAAGEASAMVCGGCAAKVGRPALELALSRLPPAEDPSVRLGLAARDDVSVTLSPSGDQVVSSIDAFRAFSDDAFLVGRVAAANALSDLFARGVAPRHALAMVSLPMGEPGHGGCPHEADALTEVLAGARAAFEPAGVTLVGGHSLVGPELCVGFTALGYAAADIELASSGRLAPGELLILTKALGTGVLLRADAMGLLPGPEAASLWASMVRLNDEAMVVMRAHDASAGTDVTGFGLLGHLAALCRRAGASAELWLDDLPALPGARAQLARGVRSTFHDANAAALGGVELGAGAAQHPLLDLALDPQTSGGLLMALPPERAAEALVALAASGHAAAVVGRVLAPAETAAQVRLLARRADEGRT
ncbi:MAG: selenide, water dikinase SelD [Deltaproteobacteria bacterium]|nr:selenide, water dikinase SelD [Deltaproteobacteria bacterium]